MSRWEEIERPWLVWVRDTFGMLCAVAVALEALAILYFLLAPP